MQSFGLAMRCCVVMTLAFFGLAFFGLAFFGLGVMTPGQAAEASPPAANLSEADAAIAQGILLATSVANHSNDETAFYWYFRAANLNSPMGNDFVGNGWRDGRGIRKSLNEAVKYYSLAVQGGNVAAMKSLAEFYENGVGLARDRDKAYELYRQAAKAGDEWAKTKAMMLDDLANVTPELVAQTLRQANGGDLSSMTRMGALSYFGVGVAMNPAKGNWWLRQAANHGEIRARLYLAEQALAQRDLAEALRWFGRAGAFDAVPTTGVAYAQYFTARILAGEFGIPPQGIDLQQAALWYVYAARADLGEAMEKLAALLRSGTAPTATPNDPVTPSAPSAPVNASNLANPHLAYYFAVLAARHRTQNALEARALCAQTLALDAQKSVEAAAQKWQIGMDFPANP